MPKCRKILKEIQKRKQGVKNKMAYLNSVEYDISNRVNRSKACVDPATGTAEGLNLIVRNPNGMFTLFL